MIDPCSECSTEEGLLIKARDCKGGRFWLCQACYVKRCRGMHRSCATCFGPIAKAPKVRELNLRAGWV